MPFWKIIKISALGQYMPEEIVECDIQPIDESTVYCIEVPKPTNEQEN